MKVDQALNLAQQSAMTDSQSLKSLKESPHPADEEGSVSLEAQKAGADQLGVARADAITRTWSRKSMITVYVL